MLILFIYLINFISYLISFLSTLLLLFTHLFSCRSKHIFFSSYENRKNNNSCYSQDCMLRKLFLYGCFHDLLLIGPRLNICSTPHPRHYHNSSISFIFLFFNKALINTWIYVASMCNPNLTSNPHYQVSPLRSRIKCVFNPVFLTLREVFNK